LPANNVLLWGARGMGKSSLVKAVHEDVAARKRRFVEASRGASRRYRHTADPAGSSEGHAARVIVFCDDLSFDHDDTAYKSLKAALDGGVEGRPDNVLFYATSNRRHLLPRHMMENEQSTAINPSEAVEEKVSLSDRFGLWLGFHKCSQDDYLTMIDGYAAHFKLKRSTARKCMPKRWNGQRHAARAPAASPGSTFRIWPAACDRARSRMTI
jgi:predicted AAA+ superfamily ATPase